MERGELFSLLCKLFDWQIEALDSHITWVYWNNEYG